MPQPEPSAMPPCSPDSERAVLGAVLRDNRTLPDVVEIITAADFYGYAHRLAFVAMADLIGGGKPADVVTVADLIRSRGQEVEFGPAGFPKFITELWDEMILPYNARHHAAIVHRTSVQRSLIHVGNEIARIGGRAADPAELIAAAEEAVFALRGAAFNANVIPQPQAVGQFLEELDRRRDGATPGPGAPISTGWYPLDSLTGGLFPSELTVIGARPSIGKTMVAVCMARAVAGLGFGVFFASLEQTAAELAARQLAAEGRVQSQRFRHADLDAEERVRLLDAAERLRPLPIWYDEHGGQTMLRIAGNARRARAKHSIRLLVIDYLQLVQPTTRRDARRTEEVGQMAREMKALAKELGIPVVALAQLNREVESRGKGEPRLSDLRDSGEIEQHADNVWLLHAPNGDDGAETLLEIHVKKCRNGPRGTAVMVHDKAYFALRPVVQ